jgi:phage gp29-like protein
MLGVGVGEFLQVEGRDYPVFQRLEPEFLRYRWNENRWYYRSILGEIPITPGDGRWVLHVPGGRVNPWRNGLWVALGRAFIKKDHALQHQANYSAKLANPARVASAPAGATETQRMGWMSKIIAWGINSVFETPPGWTVSLLESNGKGWEVFSKETEQADNEFMISLAGQVVTTTGGTGFANADVHRLIRNDIIQDVGDALSHTLNTQALPLFCWIRGGASAVATGIAVEYQTKAPKDHEVEARTMLQLGTAITGMTAALAPFGKTLSVDEIATRYDIPIEDISESNVVDLTEFVEEDQGNDGQDEQNAA